MSTVRRQDVLVPVTFDDAEARFLASLVMAAAPHLTDAQAEIAQRIAGKFMLSSENRKRELIDTHGLDAVLDYATSAYADELDRITEVSLP